MTNRVIPFKTMSNKELAEIYHEYLIYATKRYESVEEIKTFVDIYEKYYHNNTLLNLNNEKKEMAIMIGDLQNIIALEFCKIINQGTYKEYCLFMGYN